MKKSLKQMYKTPEAQSAVEAWQETSSFLESLRLKALSKMSTPKAMKLLNDAAEAALKKAKSRESSGLVDMYEILNRKSAK